ncbi:MAG TPA: COX15/CtaA family protein [Xanthobacteraceae bacterium]|nr:COX15/CtaA family protein [Xanthobacteraceae bacterium]
MDDVSSMVVQRAVRGWLLAVAGLIFLMVLVGGITRLTGSGLSIVEWQPVTGILPPLSEEAWRAEFEKYKAIPQYREQNRGMSLEAFKAIYWWEWAHRLLGRIIGLAFLVPFLFLLWRGWIEKQMQLRLWTIFGLGALQGVIGWWMVTSGLSQRVSVAHERLAIHLTLACVIYAAILWTAQELRARGSAAVSARFRTTAIVIVVLVLVQIYLGALVAGLRGGLIYNTWPLIDGALVPSAERLFFLTPVWSNFFDNVLTVQFEHRMAAYLLWLLAVGHAVHAAAQPDKAAFNGALALAVFVTIQAGIGIFTLLYAAPPLLALMHQGMAIVVLSLAVIHAQRLTPARVQAETAAAPFVSRS